MDSNVNKLKPSGRCIRVVVTEINPQAYYKTLEISHHTTVFEVVVKLIRKYALNDDDRDPNEFYLTEVSTTGMQHLQLIQCHEPSSLGVSIIKLCCCCCCVVVLK